MPPELLRPRAPHHHDPGDSADRSGGLGLLGGGGHRVPRIGIGGPVGSGKTALVAALCRALSGRLSIGVVTNDIYTTEDADFLRRAGVLPADRIRAVQTGACPHTAIRDDISANLDAVEDLVERYDPDLVLVESGGDNLTATFSYGLVDRQIFVVDTAGGDDVPRKGGPGVAGADLLVINKVDLAPLVGADTDRMATDAARVRAVETGCCPHTAIRDDISANLDAVEDLEAALGPLDLVLVESGGDNLTATFSKGLIDQQIFVVDVAGGDKVPRKGGPGVTTADLLIINKTDLAPYVGANLDIMASDAKKMRGERPFIFTNLRSGDGVDTVIAFIREQGLLGQVPAFSK